MLTLYHGRTSVCSIKARLALAEKGMRFDSQLITLRGDQFDPGYMKLNPNAVVPTIVHDGRVVVESTVIMHYVEEAFPGPALMPADPLARSKVRQVGGRIRACCLHETDLRDGEPRLACSEDTAGDGGRAGKIT
jgi:glutathione S-transferase